MSKLSTKSVKGSGLTTPKEIQPGNGSYKINKVELEEFKLRPGSRHVILYMESVPMANGFEGFLIDKDKPELGKYAGQVGRVKAGEWAYEDGTTKSGVQVFRDDEILKFIKTLCQAVGQPGWLDTQDDKHDTIESLVDAFNAEKPYAGVFLNFCIAGKMYKNKQGYDTYDLFLPKFSRKGVPFESVDVKTSKLLNFNTEEHIKVNKKKEVESFGSGDDVPVSPAASKSFEI